MPGDPFKLGKLNTINRVTQLVGANPNKALLRIDNNSTGANATALELQVEPGKPPMSANSTTEVQGLNVDQVDGQSAGDFLGDDETATNASNLDGKDSTAFFSGKTYNAVGRPLCLPKARAVLPRRAATPRTRRLAAALTSALVTAARSSTRAPPAAHTVWASGVREASYRT